jgi:hypothetical protein
MQILAYDGLILGEPDPDVAKRLRDDCDTLLKQNLWLRKKFKRARRLIQEADDEVLRLTVALYEQGRQMDEMAQMIGYQHMEIARLKRENETGGV